MSPKRFLSSAARLATAATLSLLPALLHADSFSQTNLVSKIPGQALFTDANLSDPWGLAYSATSPFWVSNQGSGTATLYNGAGLATALVVTVPGGSAPTGPTGQVFSGGLNFGLPNGATANFIFDTLQGTIAAWNSNAGTTAVTMVTTPGAIYTGLALATSSGSNYIYAADSTGQIRVFNSSFAPVTLTGNFTDPNAVTGFVPFNIQLVGSQLYVTYAKLGAGGSDQAGGYVDVFNTNGTFISRFASGGALFAPWGIALAPSSFGIFSNDLLIGNNGNGQINAFDPTTGAFIGTLDNGNGQAIVNNDLWALAFRTGGTGVNTSALYFTGGGSNGLFGEITSTPEPVSLVLTGLGILGLAAKLGTSRRKSRVA